MKRPSCCVSGRLRWAPLLLGLVMLFNTGCGGPIIEVSGIEVHERHWNQTVEELTQRAQYELSCEELEFQLFRKLGRHPLEVGVGGCGHRVVYLRRSLQSGLSGWVLNSEIRHDTTPTSASSEPPPAPSRTLTASPEVRTAREGEQLVGVEAKFFAFQGEVTMRFAPSLSSQVRVTVASSTAVPLSQCQSLEAGRGARILLSSRFDGHVSMVDREALFSALSEARYVQFCGRSWLLNARDASGLRRFQALTEEILASAADASGEPAPEEGSGSTTTSYEPAATAIEQVRGRLDAAKALIEACVGQELPIGVEAVWDEAGVVRASVRGESDVAVGACVTAALGEWRVSADGPGRVIHVVQ